MGNGREGGGWRGGWGGEGGDHLSSGFPAEIGALDFKRTWHRGRTRLAEPMAVQTVTTGCPLRYRGRQRSFPFHFGLPVENNEPV